MNKYSCSTGRENGKTWTLQKWLDNFHIEESEEMAAEWNKLMSGLAAVTCKMDEKEIQGDILGVLLYVLYVNYDINKPYIPQVDGNMILAKEIFKTKFHKDIEF